MARSPLPPRAWQRMLSGRRLDLLDPSPLDIEIEDIAHGLARVPRWNGQTQGDHIFSVAQHSVLVGQIAQSLRPDMTPKLRLAVLLHDAAEYVIGDMISPFKAIIGEPYKDVERRLMGAVHIRFGLPARLPAPDTAFIKKADSACAYFEATQLAGFSEAEARMYFKKVLDNVQDMDLTPWPAPVAERRFLDAFETAARALSQFA